MGAREFSAAEAAPEVCRRSRGSRSPKRCEIRQTGPRRHAVRDSARQLSPALGGLRWYDARVSTLHAALGKAHYELLEGGEGFYGEIPGFAGVLAQGATLEACREELASTLEDWILFRVSRHLPVPVASGPPLIGLDLKNPGKPAPAVGEG